MRDGPGDMEPVRSFHSIGPFQHHSKGAPGLGKVGFGNRLSGMCIPTLWGQWSSPTKALFMAPSFVHHAIKVNIQRKQEKNRSMEPAVVL